MPKPSLKRNINDSNLLRSEGIMGFMSFPEVNVIVQLDFELTYFKAVIQYVRQDATGTFFQNNFKENTFA